MSENSSMLHQQAWQAGHGQAVPALHGRREKGAGRLCLTASTWLGLAWLGWTGLLALPAVQSQARVLSSYLLHVHSTELCDQ